MQSDGPPAFDIFAEQRRPDSFTVLEFVPTNFVSFASGDSENVTSILRRTKATVLPLTGREVRRFEIDQHEPPSETGIVRIGVALCVDEDEISGEP